MSKFNPEIARHLLGIASENGKIFSVEFEKKDGTIRQMTCRKDVRKHLKGGPTTYNPAVNMGVFDMKIQEYRSFAYDRVIKVNGQSVVPDEVNAESITI